MSSSVSVHCVCACVCVCKRKRERERLKEFSCGTCWCVLICVLFPCVCVCVISQQLAEFTLLLSIDHTGLFFPSSFSNSTHAQIHKCLFVRNERFTPQTPSSPPFSHTHTHTYFSVIKKLLFTVREDTLLSSVAWVYYLFLISFICDDDGMN